MLDTCDFTVAAPMKSSWKISALLEPRAIKSQHLALPVGESLQTARHYGIDGKPVGKPADEASGDRRRQQGSSVSYGANRGDEFLGWDVFEDKPAGAGPQHFVDVLVRVEGCQDQHPYFPVGLLDDPGSGL